MIFDNGQKIALRTMTWIGEESTHSIMNSEIGTFGFGDQSSRPKNQG
jgi:hypothetical protein